MTKRIALQISLLVLLLTASNSLFAQDPTTIHTKVTNSNSPEGCAEQFAGNVSFSNFVGQSDDIWGGIAPDTIYLCANDKFDLSISGQDLTGDPNMATPAGVGYALYSCAPTITGTSLNAVKADCHHEQAGKFLVSTGNGDLSGSQTFLNSGGIQNLLSSGDPLCVWFAPITYDAYDVVQGPVYENMTCINVNTADRFSVVYLNPIEIKDLNNNVNGFACKGSFRILGGLPEYDGTSSFTVDVSLVSDPSVKALILNKNTGHSNTVRFQVGQDGDYKITISDGKSCTYTETVTMSSCPTIPMNMTSVKGLQNSNICIPITVENFSDISGLEFKMNWDPSIVTFYKVTSTNLPNIITNNTGSGELTFSWISLVGGVTIPDGGTAFEICFNLTGDPGTETPVIFSPNIPSGIVLADKDGNQFGLDDNSIPGAVAILSPSAINVNLVSTPPKCAGGSDGTIGLTLDAATNFPVAVTYTHAITGAPNGNLNIMNSNQVTITDLTAGVYNLSLTDNSGEVLDTFIEVDPGFQLGVNLPQVDTKCFGDQMSICPVVFKNSSAITDFTGYTFLWNGGSTQRCQTAIPSGFFAVTVTDPNGCNASASGTLIQPAEINSNPVITHPACTGVNNGQVFLQPDGGDITMTGSYKFNWESNNPQDSPSLTISNLGPGTYNVTITDNNNCSVTEAFTLTYQKEVKASVEAVDITCNGADNGSIVAKGTTIGGVEALPYTYNWNPGGPGNNSQTNLSAGSYEVTVTDAVGCLDSASATISEPSPMEITLENLTHESCTSGTDGQITISVIGGGGGYSYNWSNSTSIAATANNLSSGSHTVTVTDASGCQLVKTYTINPPTVPTINNFTKVDIKCPTDNNGSLTVNVTEGNGQNLSFSWGDGSTQQMINGLSQGSHCVTVSDEYGCQATACEEILATEEFDITNVTFQMPTCPGESNGFISIEMAGSGNYQFLEDTWNAAGGSYILNSISAGMYNVTITDLSSSCPAIDTSFVLEDPASILTTLTLQEGVSCFDGTHLDGKATASSAYSDGTTGNFNFTWGPNMTSCLGAQSCASTNLGLGKNWVTVDDGVCTVTDTIIVGGPDSIKIRNSVITNTSCYKDSDGMISIEVEGGNPGYTYGWTAPANMQNAADVNNLPAGNYTVSVTDAVGCAETFNFVVDEPDSLQLLLDLTKTVNVYCFGEATGQIYVQPIGGNEGYTYVWNPNISDSNVASFLEAGSYSVTVTDTKGCEQNLTHILTENPPIDFVINPIDEPQCFGYQTIISLDTATGGAGAPYTYSVDYSPPQSILLDYQVFADSHFVVVYDAFECSSEQSVKIGEPDEIYLNLPAEVEVELGDSLQLNPVVSSSLPIDSFYWTPTDFLNPSSAFHPFVVGLSDDQVYELTVIDENGCEQVAEILVEVDRNRNVYIPNVFSPNNDGFNDAFHPKTGIGVKEILSMVVFDRWGDIVFSAKNFLPGDNSPESWDGTFRGQPVSPGVFIYMIEVEFLDGIKLLYRGDITLLR